jgi:hypothetical protein
LWQVIFGLVRNGALSRPGKEPMSRFQLVFELVLCALGACIFGAVIGVAQLVILLFPFGLVLLSSFHYAILISIPVNCVLLPAVTIWMREKSYQPWLLSIVGALGGYVSPYIVAFIEPLLANQPMLSPPLNAPRSPLLILAVPAAIAGYFCARLFRPLARGASLFG